MVNKEDFFSVENAREARKKYVKDKAQAAFDEASELEEFKDLLEDIKIAATQGKSKLNSFLPRSEAFYLQCLKNNTELTSDIVDFSENDRKAFEALRQLGYVVNIVSYKDAVGHNAVFLEGMNPAREVGLQISQANIVWG